MNQEQFGGHLPPLRDPASGQTIQGKCWGTFSYQLAPGTDPSAAQMVKSSLPNAIGQVIAQKLASQQVAVPTIPGSVPYYTQEFIAASGAAARGVHISELSVQVQVDNPYAQQQMAAPLPPDPMSAMKNAFAEEAKSRLDPSNYEVRAKINVGGIKIGASTSEGIDTDAIGEQLADKAKSTVLWYAIGCVVLLFVVALLGGIGIYVYLEMAGGSSATAAKAASWDGKTPFTCGGNDKVTIEGVNAKLASGTAVNVGGNCQATLINVTIDAPIAISALSNGKVTVTGGRITGSQFAAKALGSGASISFQGTTVSGKTQALGGATISGP